MLTKDELLKIIDKIKRKSELNEYAFTDSDFSLEETNLEWQLYIFGCIPKSLVLYIIYLLKNYHYYLAGTKYDDGVLFEIVKGDKVGL